MTGLDREEIRELERKGERDLTRLDAKIREAIRRDIRKYITNEALITGPPKKRVKIKIQGMELPQFKFGDNQGQGQGGGIGSGRGDMGEGDKVKAPAEEQAGEGEAEHTVEEEVSIEELVDMAFEELGLPRMEDLDEDQIKSQEVSYDDIRRSGPMSMVDKRRTLKANMARNAVGGAPVIQDIIREDLRFRSFVEKEEFRRNALIVCMMDVSGSMTDNKKYIVRMTLWWIKRYLERLYDGLTFEFVIHDTVAHRVDEESFFSTSTGGGTYISSAFQKAIELMEQDYASGRWNVYVFYFSDGENWDDDNPKAVELANSLIERSRMLFYGQVLASTAAKFNETLEEGVEDMEGLRIAVIEEEEQIVKAIETFLHE